MTAKTEFRDNCTQTGGFLPSGRRIVGESYGSFPAGTNRLPVVRDYGFATYSFLLSQKCSKKIQKIIDTELVLWNSRSTHGNK